MKIDKSNMRQAILDFPKQFRIGLRAAGNIKVIGNFDGVIVCGMGGSALPAGILNMWIEAKRSGISLNIHSDYGLPHFIKDTNLVICISYSGNTEETISAFEEARRRNLKITAISSGGKLAELCKLHKIPLAVIPSGLQPRMALGFQFAALMKILANCGLINADLKDIHNLENSLNPGDSEDQGKKLAKNLKNKIPIIYASSRLKYLDLARIWKIKFNENSKIPAFCNYFPELNHNELVGFENNGYPASIATSIIILRDNLDLPRIKERMELTAEILKPTGVQTQFVDIKGEDILCKIFDNILLSDWTSYYLALEYKIDPTPVKLNDEFKRRLA